MFSIGAIKAMNDAATSKRATSKADTPWMTVAQVAAELILSDDLVLKLCTSGKLRSVPIGDGKERKLRRIRREWLEDYLKECERADQQIRRSLAAPARRGRRTRNLLHV